MPFSAQKQLNQTMELPKPKATLTSAVAMRPPASSFVGEDRAPSTPDANLENPYLRRATAGGRQCMQGQKPISSIERHSSAACGRVRRVCLGWLSTRCPMLNCSK